MFYTSWVLTDLKPGDWVMRILAGTIPMRIRVTHVTEDRIYCGEPGTGWEFDRETGAEIDYDLGWGPPPRMTGSFILGPDITTDEEAIKRINRQE